MTLTEAESKGVGVSQLVVFGLGDLVEDLEVELAALNALLFGIHRRDSTSIYLVMTPPLKLGARTQLTGARPHFPFSSTARSKDVLGELGVSQRICEE